MKFSVRLNLLLLIPLVLLLLAYLFGSWGLFREAFIRDGVTGLGNFDYFFGRADYIRALGLTHWIALLTTLISLALGYPTALIMVLYPRTRAWLILLVLTPLLTSLVVRTFSWIVVLGPSGIVNEALMGLGLTSEPVRLLFNTLGVVIGLVHVFFPLAIFAMYTVLSKIDRNLNEAALSLGDGPLRAHWRVTLPLAATGIFNAASVVYLLSAGAIVTPTLLGGPSSQMLGTLVYTSIFRFFDFPRAASVAIVLTASAFVVVALIQGADRYVARHLNARRG